MNSSTSEFEDGVLTLHLPLPPKTKEIAIADICSRPHPTFNGPFSGTNQVSRNRKGKTNLDFTRARDSEWHVASAGPYASLHLASDRQPRQHPTAQLFTGRVPFL